MMKSSVSGKNISLTSYDDIFSATDSQSTFPFGKIVEIPLEELYAFKNHPFRVLDDEQMEKTAESIKDFGVLIPGLDVRGLKVDMRLFLVTGENALQKLLERKLCQ